MTELSAPWLGLVTGDATMAPYDDEEWARIWRELIRANKPDNGPLMGSGVSPDPGLTVRATGPASASVEVTSGTALVRGTWYASDATVTLAIAANASGNPRIDTIILRKNYAAQTIRLAVKQGTAAGSPVPPSLDQIDSSLWELPLADIAVANGFATITNADITFRRHFANLADGVYLMDALNNSGATLEDGDVVVWDSTTDRAVTTTTTIGLSTVAGVWRGRTGAGGYGRVQTRGIGYVNITGAISRLGRFETSATAKKAVAVTGSELSTFGFMLETLAGTGRGLAVIDVDRHPVRAVASAASVNSNTSTSLTFVDTRADHKVTITPKTTSVRVTATFIGSTQDTTKIGYWDLYSTSLAVRAGGAYGLATTTGAWGPSNLIPITIVAIFTGLAPNNTQEFKLQHKTSDGASYVQTAGPVTMWAEEI